MPAHSPAETPSARIGAAESAAAAEMPAAVSVQAPAAEAQREPGAEARRVRAAGKPEAGALRKRGAKPVQAIQPDRKRQRCFFRRLCRRNRRRKRRQSVFFRNFDRT